MTDVTSHVALCVSSVYVTYSEISVVNVFVIYYIEVSWKQISCTFQFFLCTWDACFISRVTARSVMPIAAL